MTECDQFMEELTSDIVLCKDGWKADIITLGEHVVRVIQYGGPDLASVYKYVERAYATLVVDSDPDKAELLGELRAYTRLLSIAVGRR